MKIHLKGKYQTGDVWLNGNKLDPAKSRRIHDHSVEFSWGYPGSGPGQLALAICMELFGPKANYMDFKWKYISTLPASDFDTTIEIPIPYFITQQPDAAEIYFCRPFEQLPRLPISIKDKVYQLQDILEKGPDFFEKMPISQIQPFAQYVYDFSLRIPKYFSYSIKNTNILSCLCLITDGDYAPTVMCLTWFQYWCKKNNHTEITWEIFKQIFPDGFPPQNELKDLWYSLKIERKYIDQTGNNCDADSDNLLDYKTAIQSLL